MWREIFYFVNYTFNPHAIPTFLATALLLTIGSTVVVREKASQISLKFFYLTSALAGWLFCFSMMYCAELSTVGLFWAKLAYLSVPFIPVTIYLFTLSVLQLSSHYKVRVWLTSALASTFLLGALFTQNFITGIKEFWWGYYPQYGSMSYPFLVFFFALMVLSIRHFWIAYRTTPTHSRHHHRVTLFLFAIVIALLGSIDYIPKFGIAVYPAGFVPIFIFMLIAAFTISRFHLQDVTTKFAINNIMNHLSDALIVLDRDGAIRVVNQTTCDIFERKEKELMGQSIHTIAAQIISREQWNDLLDKDIPITQSETQLTTKNNNLVHANISARTMKNKKGEVEGIVCLIRDLREIKKADQARQASEERVQRLFDSNIIGIIIGNLKGDILEGNQAFLQMMNYTEKDLPCKWHEITPSEWQPKDEYALQELKMKGTATPFEKEYLRKDGSRIPILMGVALLPHSDEECVCFILDITKQKKAERKIRDLNQGLEKRVEERTAELENLIQDLEAFSYSISHDLRTPLTLINGFAKVFSDTYGDQLNHEGKTYINNILHHSKKMADLIDELLMYSQMGRKEIKANNVDFAKLCKEVCEDLKMLSPKRKIQFSLGCLPNVMGDEIMIRQILNNLIGNAIKFTRGKKIAEIEIGCIIKRERLVFYVKDNGIGFNMQHADKLFKVFQQLHTEGEFEGTGAGLAIVNRIVQRHGGKIWAESEEGKGSTFYFTLAIAPPKEQAA